MGEINERYVAKYRDAILDYYVSRNLLSVDQITRTQEDALGAVEVVAMAEGLDSAARRADALERAAEIIEDLYDGLMRGAKAREASSHENLRESRGLSDYEYAVRELERRTDDTPLSARASRYLRYLALERRRIVDERVHAWRRGLLDRSDIAQVLRSELRRRGLHPDLGLISEPDLEAALRQEAERRRREEERKEEVCRRALERERLEQARDRNRRWALRAAFWAVIFLLSSWWWLVHSPSESSFGLGPSREEVVERLGLAATIATIAILLTVELIQDLLAALLQALISVIPALVGTAVWPGVMVAVGSGAVWAGILPGWSLSLLLFAALLAYVFSLLSNIRTG